TRQHVGFAPAVAILLLLCSALLAAFRSRGKSKTENASDFLAQFSCSRNFARNKSENRTRQKQQAEYTVKTKFTFPSDVMKRTSVSLVTPRLDLRICVFIVVEPSLGVFGQSQWSVATRQAVQISKLIIIRRPPKTRITRF
ncbi:hypothetical protein M5D96_003605, partial [Drosophila gunungcola]